MPQTLTPCPLQPDEERGIMVQQRHITKDKDVK